MALVISEIYVYAAGYHAQAGIIPECPAAVDLGINVQVLAAARKDSEFWTLDLLVIAHQPERLARSVQSFGAAPCPSLIGKRLLLRWLCAADIQVHQTLTVGVIAAALGVCKSRQFRLSTLVVGQRLQCERLRAR